jgi:hypothetical protein
MIKFYLSLVAEIPSVLRGSAEAWTFWILSIGVPVLVFFAPELKPGIEGRNFSRWFVVAPITVSAAYGILRTNYMRYARLSAALKREEQERVSLAHALQRRKRNQALADALTDKHEHGIHELLNKRPSTPQEFVDWLAREHAWTASVLSLMEQFGCTKQEIHHVHTLGLFNQYLIHPDPQVNQQLCMLTERLNRIGGISNKYCEEP